MQKKMYLIDGGCLFDGTLEQFQDCFFSNATDDLIERWCAEEGYTLSVYYVEGE